MSSRTQQIAELERVLQKKQHQQGLSGSQELQISPMFYLTSWQTVISKLAHRITSAWVESPCHYRKCQEFYFQRIRSLKASVVL